MATATTILPKRSEVPVEMTWDLTTIYSTEALWEADFAQAQTFVGKFAHYKGRLARSGRILLDALRLNDEAGAIVGRLYLYAHLNNDTETTNSHYAGLLERALKLDSEIDEASSWVRPELLRIKPARLEQFFGKVEGLVVYKQFFTALMRKAKHVRSQEVEELLAAAAIPLSSPGTIRDKLDDADLKLPRVTMPDRTEAVLTQGNFVDFFLRNNDQEVRLRGFDAMMSTYKSLRNTYTACYAGAINANVFDARVRGYSGARKKLLGVDVLHLYDLYAPLLQDAELSVTYPEALKIVLNAVAPLGEEYVAALKTGYASRWIDVLENEGKTSGAYQSSVFGTAPFILLNWIDSLESAFTLGHESGHAMHSYFSKNRQPYVYAGYTIFVAEVASTVNEQLMAHYLLSTTSDPVLRLHIINRQLESIRTTIIRQTMFAEFEHLAHKRCEEKLPLTPDALAELYRSIVTRYYGESCVIDELIENEWMRISHFFNPFYVYQYATGLSAACALVKSILTDGQPAVKRYLNFLSAGKSKDSIELLKDAGVDMSSPAPVQAAFDMFDEYLDLFEKELAALK